MSRAKDDLRARRQSRVMDPIEVDVQGVIGKGDAVNINLTADNIDEGFDEHKYFTWVRSNFNIPTCQYFIPVPGNPRKCKCGTNILDHGTTLETLPEETIWDRKLHCTTMPTPSFGTMNFVNEDSIIMPNSVVAIGIANWGKVQNRNMLYSDLAGDDLIVDYRTGKATKGESSLNPHHTHFFLVDGGDVGKSGEEIRYRIELQDIIQDLFVHEGAGLSKICILLEGGESSIDTAIDSVQHSNPLLIVKNTGRAADIICFALENAERYEKVTGPKIYVHYKLNEDAAKTVKRMIEKDFHRYGPQVCKRMYDKVAAIVDRHDMCRIYDSSNESSLDHAILLTLISSITSGRHSLGAATRQMELAITWNQPVVAQDHILSKHTFEPTKLNHFLRIAIDTQSLEFVRMFLHQGADLKELITVAELTRLYNELPQESIAFQQLCSMKQYPEQEFNLHMVSSVIEEFLDGAYRCSLIDYDINDPNTRFNDPYDHMMLWSTLRGNYDMAMLFWEFTRAPAISALVSFRMCARLAEIEDSSMQSDEDAMKEMIKAANMFEEHAVGITR
eukprot:sb/3463542/